MPTFQAIDVLTAAKRIEGTVRRTELRRSDALSTLADQHVYLKLECEQVTGSFKIRGAYNVLAALPDEVRRRGVVAASAGNHGMGVAHAARKFGVPATIHVPSSVPRVKRDGITDLGASVHADGAHFDDARQRAEDAARDDGTTFIHPCEGEVLIAGQGTVALEVLLDQPLISSIIVPVGGAGLVAGIASLTRTLAPAVRIIGVQTDNTDALARALAAGHPMPTDHKPTIAEGLAGEADAYALDLARFAVDDMIVVSEEETARAVAWLHRNEGLVVEGSGAVGVAALLFGHLAALPGPSAVIITGRNIDPDRHQEIVRRYG